MDELEALIERKVEERMDEEQSYLQEKIHALIVEKEKLMRERDRALYLAVEAGVTPVLRVNMAGQQPIFMLVRCDTSEEWHIKDSEEAIKMLLEEKEKAVAEGGSKYG